MYGFISLGAAIAVVVARYNSIFLLQNNLKKNEIDDYINNPYLETRPAEP